MNTKNVILALAIATVLLVAMVGSASADNPGCVKNGDTSVVYRCGDTVEFNCTFNGSILNCPSGSWGLKVGAHGIVIDGANYNITGNENAIACDCADEGVPAVHSGIYNVDGYDNVEIKNLEVENFCTGIALDRGIGADKVTNNKVLDCKIHDNGNSTAYEGCCDETSTHGIHLVKAESCEIRRCDIYRNTGRGSSCSAGGNGIFFYALSAGNNIIKCNHCYDNRLAGIFMKKGCHHNTIEYNNASGNSGPGIAPKCKKANNNTIRYNYVVGNGGHGFDSQAAHNTYKYNTIRDNTGEGIHIDAGHDGTGNFDYGIENNITNNTICGNGGVDIWITDDSYGWTNTIDENTCDSSNNATAFACDDWKCDTLVSVYYDFDGDNYYSNTTENCACNNILNVGSCCNLGLFNSSGAGQHCAGGVCTYPNPGTDPNDCDDSILGSSVDWYCDNDNDEYISSTVSGSGAPGEKPSECQFNPGDDCDDTNADVNPGATENCTNGIDDDCDGLIDMADPDCAAPGEEVTVSATVAVAAPEVVCKCEGPDDDPVKPGTQVEPNLWPDTKTVMKCAIVCDPNGIGDIKYVNATTYYPDGTIKETQTMHVANESEKAACCCDTTGLPNETCQVYAGYITMEACDPAGNYSVTVIATDNGGATGELSNQFEYLSVIGLDLDLNAVGFGTIAPGETKVVPGDDAWGAPNLTVHSIGNDPIDIEVSATDMTSDGNTITKDNIDCEIDALGSQWLSAPFTFDIDLECCSYENVNLSLHVPEGTAQGAYTGKVTFVAKHA